METRNRADSKASTDSWLTPLSLLTPLGRFDLDPCCPPNMPWQTAERMISLPEDGLAAKWVGRVWCNPPWSDPLPWAQKMAKHNDGVWLSSAKSTDTRWGQLILENADATLFLAGRPLFHYPDGTPSTGKWTPVLVAAFGQDNVLSLYELMKTHPGMLFHNYATKTVIEEREGG